MASKIMFFCFVGVLSFSCCIGGIIPAVPAAPIAYSVPYASSYSASVINHAVASPVVSAPLVARPAVAVRAPAFAAPFVAAPAYRASVVPAPLATAFLG